MTCSPSSLLRYVPSVAVGSSTTLQAKGASGGLKFCLPDATMQYAVWVLLPQACADRLDQELRDYGVPPKFPVGDEAAEEPVAAAAVCQLIQDPLPPSPPPPPPNSGALHSSAFWGCIFRQTYGHQPMHH